MNPTQEAEQQKTLQRDTEIQQLNQEVISLRGQLKTHEQTSGARISKEVLDIKVREATEQLRAKMNTITQEKHDYKARLADMTKQHDKLRTFFKKKVGVFRERIQQLTGYGIH